ncbi:MAG: DNA mismatch repair protein MutS [Methanosarcinales archaeon]|nr:DNA mismatch repair protein MutS [Methanosarcinales archaeon]
MRDRLVEHFGSEEGAVEALLGGEVAELTAVLSERQAVTLARWSRALQHGADPQEFLATEEAARVYEKILERMAGYTHTDYARLKMSTLFPTSSRELIEEFRTLAWSAREQVQRLEGCGMDRLLGAIRPLRHRSPTRIRDRVVAVTSSDLLRELKARGLDRTLDLQLVESRQELQDMVAGYSHVCLVGEDLDGGRDGGSDQVERAESLEDWYLAPEAVLSYYQDNLKVLEPALQAAAILESRGFPTEKGLADLEKLIRRLGEGEDPEVRRIRGIMDLLTPCVDQETEWANAELKSRMEARSVTLAGADLLQAMGRGEGIKEIFAVQMRATFQGVLREARDRAASRLDLKGPEAVRLEEVFSSEMRYPLEINRQALHRLEQDLRQRLSSLTLKEKRSLARALLGHRERAARLVGFLLEFDFVYALGSFALQENLTMPRIVGTPALGIRGGRNLFLKDAKPVSYSLGETGLSEFKESVALLSGVNSGGKTSLLDLIAQVAILAQMGMPVPCEEAALSVFDQLYYFGKSRGTLSAGAFETAMKKFAVVENDLQKIVLADELEAITEPGASARIIACMLDELQQLGSVAVFVSHLAEEVRRFSTTAVRIDGIEAQGLDEDNNLVVNRTPRYHYLARSTPELILDRLVRTTSGQEREFYQRLLQRFR